MIAEIKFVLPEQADDCEACMKGAKYKRMIDELYEDVFRPHIKYEKPIIGDDLRGRDLDVIAEIWNKCKEHFEVEG